MAVLAGAGWDAVHVHDVGLSRATDAQILAQARKDGRTCVTLDADFHALLAVANSVSPSVIRIRREGLRGEALAKLLLTIAPQIEQQVRQGAMVTVTESSVRVRRLPILTKPPQQ